MDYEFTFTKFWMTTNSFKHALQNMKIQNYSLTNTNLLNKFSWHSTCSRQLHQWHSATTSSTVTGGVLYPARRIDLI